MTPTPPDDTFAAPELPIALVPQSLAEVRAMIEAMSPDDRLQLSPAWLAALDDAAHADLWVHGFKVIQRDTDARVGSAGFKGPPDADATVEIAYGIDESCRGRGYATAATTALLNYAQQTGAVRVVRAHTRPTNDASARVLSKNGFERLGEVIDPEDGLVWRWERPIGSA